MADAGVAKPILVCPEGGDDALGKVRCGLLIMVVCLSEPNFIARGRRDRLAWARDS